MATGKTAEPPAPEQPGSTGTVAPRGGAHSEIRTAPPPASTMFFYWCPNCPQKLHAKPEHVGYRARCPRCGKVHAVPDPDDPFLVGMDDPHSSAVQKRRAAGLAAFEKTDPFARFRPTSASERRSNIFRACPGCRRILEVDNEWCGLICRYCGQEIPAGGGGG